MIYPKKRLILAHYRLFLGKQLKLTPKQYIFMIYIELDKKRGDIPLFSVYNDGEKKNKKEEVTSWLI